MKRSFNILIYTFIFICLISYSIAYTHETSTHKQLTAMAVEYLFSKTNLNINKGQLQTYLEEGAEKEDSFPRYSFHFTPKLGFLEELGSLIARANCDSIKWGFEKVKDCYVTLPSLYCTPLMTSCIPVYENIYLENIHTWEDAKVGGEEGWRHLGYILHLLEDLGAPSHTRDDIHISVPKISGGANLDYDIFEKINKNRPMALPIKEPLVDFTDPKEAFNKLQNFTQSNFFSDDRCFHPRLLGPSSVREDSYYFYDIKDNKYRKIAYKGLRYYISWSPFTGYNKTKATIDDVIALEQFDELAPKAIVYAASLIKYYYDQFPSSPPSLELYDTFDSPNIDPNKWQYLEYVREIRSGKLFLKVATTDDQTASSNLSFVNSNLVNSFQADVTLQSYKAEDTSARARLIAAFCNDGVTSGGGDAGEIYAEIQLGGYDSPQPYASISVGRCNDADCLSYTNFYYRNLGNIIFGVPHKLFVGWNGSIITFSFDGITRTFNPKPYAPNLVPAKKGFKALNVFKFTRSGGIRIGGGKGSVAATFDNVLVNGVPYDNFNAGQIDPNKWKESQFVREIQNGKLVSKLRLIGLTGSNYLSFPDPNSIKSIKTDVVVHSFETQDANTRARLSGRFYNDGTPGGGDVVAEIWVGGNSPTPELEYGVGRCNDRDCRSFTNFQYGSFGTASLGQIYTLFLGWDGSIFTFKVNDMTRIIDPRPYAPVVYSTPQVPFKSIETRKTTRVGGTITYGGSGWIHATFDNVFISH